MPSQGLRALVEAAAQMELDEEEDVASPTPRKRQGRAARSQTNMQAFMKLTYKCQVCNSTKAPTSKSANDTWLECQVCCSWSHQVCLTGDVEGHTELVVCPACKRKEQVDSAGGGILARHVADSNANSLLQLLDDMQRSIPTEPGASRRRTTGLMSQVVTRQTKELQQDRALVSGKRIGLMGLVGETNQGKTTIADSIFRMTAPMPYLPFDGTLDSRKLCQRLKTELLDSAFAGRKEIKLGELTWDPAKPHDIFGPPAFNASGLLLQGDAEIAAELQYTKDLVQAVLSGQPADQGKTRGFLMPLFRQGQTNGPNCAGVTTANNTIVMRGGRCYALLQCLNKSLLLDVVLTCKEQGNALSKAVVTRLAAIFNLSPKEDSSPPRDNSDSDSDSDDEDECAQRSLRKQIMELPDSRHALADAVDKKLRGLLDSVIEVPLPGISRQHDLLFLQRLLRQLSGVDIDQNTPRPAWMALVWQAWVWLDDWLLHPGRGVMDMPGEDTNPFHQVIRREGFKQIDSVMLVLKRPLHLSSINAYERMLQNKAAKAAHLPVRIEQGEVALTIMGNQCDWMSFEDLRSHNDTDFEQWKAANKQVIKNQLQSKRLSKNVRYVTFRPVMAASLMLAVSYGNLPEDEKLEEALKNTGLRDVYEALNVNSGRYARAALERSTERQKSIARATSFVMQHSSVATAAQLKQAKQQLLLLKPHLERFKSERLHHGDRTEYLEYLQGRGLGEGEEPRSELPDIIVYNSLKMLCLKDGKQVTECNLELHPFKPDPKAAQTKSRSKADMPDRFTTQHSFQRFILLLQQLKDEVKQQDGVQYSPSLHQLIDWPLLIDMPKLQPLITPLLTEEVEWLKYAKEKVGDQIPANSLAGRVLELHVKHLLPLLRFEPKTQAGLTGPRTELLDDLRRTLQLRMQQRLELLLEALIIDVKRRRKAAAAGSSSAAGPAAAAAGGGGGMAPDTEGTGARSSRSITPSSCAALFAKMPADATPPELFKKLIELTFPDKGSDAGKEVLEAVRDTLYKLVAKHLGTGSTTTGKLLNWLRGDLALLGLPNEVFLDRAQSVRPEEGAAAPAKTLQEAEKRGAKQATQLMIMYHTHQQLLSRYRIHRLLAYDNSSAPNWAAYEAAFRSVAPVIIGSAGWQAALPDAGRVQEGRTVDVAQFCKAFAQFVCGLEGKKHVDAGAVVPFRPLEPSDILQQQEALQDMLVAELVHEGRKQLLHGEDHHLFKMFGITPCEALMRGTLEHNPWLVLNMLAHVSGNTLCVLVEGQSAGAAAAAAAGGSSSSKKGKSAGSKRSSGSGDGAVVVLQPPKQEVLWKVVQPPTSLAAEAGAGQEDGEAVGPEDSLEEEDEEGGQSELDWFDSDISSEQGDSAGADSLQQAAATVAAGGGGSASDGLAAAFGRSRVTHLVLKLRNNSWKLLHVTSGICTQPGVGAAAGVHTASGHGASSSSKRQRVSFGSPVSGGSSSTRGRGSVLGNALQVGVSGPDTNYDFCIVCDSREGLVPCSSCHVSACEAHCSQGGQQAASGSGDTWRCTACCRRGK